MIVVYKCEKCGKEFKGDNSWDECRVCEDSHISPSAWSDDVKPVKYLRGKKYPEIINVTFADGSVHQFRYEDIVKVPEEVEEDDTE